MIEKKSFRASFFRTLNVAVLCLFALTVLFPFYYVLVLSFNEGTDTLRGGVMLFPRVFTLDNYKKAFEYSVIANSLWISFSRTAIVLVCKLFLTSLLRRQVCSRVSRAAGSHKAARNRACRHYVP